MREIPNLEIHVAHACNLACESCSHYSNQGHKGIVSLEEADRWMTPWVGRLRPRWFSLLGGEPTIHPRLAEFVLLARRRWPDAHIRLVSNGFLLHRHPDLPYAIQGGNTGLYISIHHDAPEYTERFRPVRTLVDGWVRRHGIHAVFYPSVANWTRRYQGTGDQMEPFADGQPRQSWEICPAKYAAQLFEGKIWKCPPLAYLTLQDAKYGLKDQWRPYLAYRPLEPSCADVELNAFFDRQEEPFCSMCSAHRRPFKLPVPFHDKPAPQSSPARTPLQMVADWIWKKSA